MPMLTGGGVEVFTVDGRAATMRRLRPDDRTALEELFARASPESRRLRFFSPSERAAEAYIEHLMTAGPAEVVALVLERGDTVVGLATAEVLDATTAEISFMVADAEHGQGIGTLLVEHLAAAARNLGIVRFTADVLPENAKMNKVFRDAGFEIQQHTESGVVEVTMSTSATAAAIEAADLRECAAEAASLRPLLYPRSIALVGVRRESGGIGRAVLQAVQSGEFTGEVFVVHPEAEKIDHQEVYPSFAELPHPVDLAVVAVPAAHVLDVITAAADAGTRTAVVLSAGFGEMGAEGAAAQRALAEASRLHAIRVVGPNCLGVIANDPEIRLNATFTDILPPSGGLAIASQSGGVGIAMVDLARRTDLGILCFVSLGNKADVSGNDMLAAWMDDPKVTGAALYLESFGNTIKFARLARRFSERKPLLAVAGGRSEGGRRAGASHTAAAAAPAVAVDALFAQSGVIGCRGISEMMHVALVLDEQPLPRGNRLGILGNAGGLGVLAADSAARRSLDVPALSGETQQRISDLVSETLGVGNPVDLGAGASPESLEACMDAMLGSGEIDSLLIVAARTGVTGSEDLLHGVASVRSRHPELPVLVVGLGFGDFDRTGLTVFEDAETATEALSRAVSYATWRSTPAGDLPPIDVQRGRRIRMQCQELIAGPTSVSGWLSAPECQGLLSPYGIEGPIGSVASDLAELRAAADGLGFPVAVKVADPSVLHKSDRGLVHLGVADATALEAAVESIRAEMGSTCDILVQPQIRGGVEVALGTVRDPRFGPLVMVAAGGVATEVWGDRQFLMPPVTEQDARRALAGLRIHRLLAGFRGAPAVDLDALVDMVVRLGSLVSEVPEVAELDLNPVIATRDGMHVVDVKIRLEASGSEEF